MPRLYHGSLGTLGVVISANFKVLPRPRAETTVLVRHDCLEAAFAEAHCLHAQGPPLAALEVAFLNGAWTVAARVEGREQTVNLVTARVTATIGGDQALLAGPESANWWTDYVARQTPQSPTAVIVRCGARPSQTATLAAGIVNALANLEIAVPTLTASPGIGVVSSHLDFADFGSPDKLAECQSVLLALADTVTIVAAPPAWKRGLDIWGRLPDGFAVMRSLREQFDPTHTINPGRYAGFL
jgi:glycolate oxidase FAD binding subunit